MRAPLARDVGILLAAGLPVVTTVWGRAPASRAEGLLALDVGIAVLAVALTPLLPRRTLPAGLALAVLAAVSPAATPPATMGTLLTARRRRLPVAVAVGVAGVAAHAVQGLWRPIPGLSYVWWLVLVVAAHAALTAWGAFARARCELLESLRERARRAEAEQAQRIVEARAHERTRIAREAHDVLAHRLSLLATYAGAVEYRPDAPPEQLARAAGVLRAGVHEALEELRDVIGVLRADVVEPADSATGPLPTLDDLPELVQESRAAGADVRLEFSVDPADEVPCGLGRTAYRILQEALTNARRHATDQPVHVDVRGRRGEDLVLEVRNPLSRCTPDAAARLGSGTGLIGVAERARLAGGRVSTGSTAAGEFRLHAALPWPR